MEADARVEIWRHAEGAVGYQYTNVGARILNLCSASLLPEMLNDLRHCELAHLHEGNRVYRYIRPRT